MSLRNLKVLIVDDNISDRLIVKSILLKLRVASVQEAEDGAIAESKLLTADDISQRYDVVILDWNMPRANGHKLLKIIKSNWHLKNTKVIVMTATANQDVVEDAIHAGASDFIVKPVELALLQGKLEKLFP